jgi:(heptosyl)LPS beta-1,4-glucosyltransferase
MQNKESGGRPTIGAYMITKNEEKNIGAALASVSWADEIVVLDSGSTDKTVEIAAQAGARVVNEPFHGFVEQKNLAMNLCLSDWVFNLDADEEVTPELRQSIMDVVKKSSKDREASIFNVARKTWYMGRWILHCGWYPEYRERLSKRGVARWEGEMLHEKLRGEGRIGRLAGDLLHHPYADLGEHLEKMNMYTGLWARVEKNRGRVSHWTDILLRPPVAFMKMYIVRLGFLDYGPGLIVSIMGAWYTFLKYARLLELTRNSD